MDRVSAAAAIKNMAESHARKLDSDLRPLFASVEASPSLFEKQRENYTAKYASWLGETVP